MRKATRVAAIAFALAASFASGIARGEDDTALFSVNVPPNVMVVIDNSGSMNNVVWHPGYNAALTYSCNRTNGGETADFAITSGSSNRTRCGRTRTFFADPSVQAAGNQTRWDADYMNWMYSLPNGDPLLTEIAATGNGTYSACLLAQGYTVFSKYRRARVTAAKDVLREVICNVNQAGKVRFGLAEFRLPGGSGDPNGGFVRVPIKDYDAPTYTLPITTTTNFTGTHQQQLDLAVNALEGESWTPLGETLFSIYTYFMSRTTANRPLGLNGVRFPGYVYRTNPWSNYGSYTTTASQIPEDPVQWDCQKNFVIIITDGEPTKDDFDNSNSGDNTGQGYGSFTGLIGDYNADGEIEIQGADCVNPVADECALYLDDIAKFMQERDFRPDRGGAQVIDTYTVGFTTSPQANDLLARTAAVGNGLFFSSNNAEELADAIVGAVSDIIQKSQSFTAATVPATRTSDGGNIYTSLFLPRNDDPYWEGHLKLFNITADGDILDSTGSCALVSPSPPGECKAGAISQTAVPYWDAGEEIPDPGSRTLYTSVSNSISNFDTSSMSVSTLGDPASATDDLTFADRFLYPVQTATTAEVLADQIVQNVRGCEFGTGVGNTCLRRPWLLGDIFHSNPLVIGEPRAFVPEASYYTFAANYATRDKAIYAGANDGFLHAFDGGSWDPSPPLGEDPGYDTGTGAERFGFMPWPARRNIRHLPKDGGTRDYYYVDGSATAADVWHGPSGTTTAKAADGSEWKTLLAGGMRQGGNAYYALDVTDPDSPSYPHYEWEFPRENAPASIKNYVGETWGTPIITRVKLVISGQPYERWVAIVTGGYHPSGDPNDALNYALSATAGRSIYILDASNGQVIGEKKYQPLLLGDPQSQMRYAIASTPSVLDLDGDGFADVIYVGDLGGNVWKWVIAYDPANGNQGEDPINASGSTSQPNWEFKRFFAASSNGATLPLGVTLGSVDYYKSIFFPPAATLNRGTLWLSFATGERANVKRLGNTTTDTENNRFYSIADADPLERAGTSTTLAEDVLYDATDDGSCATLTGYSGYFFKARDSEKFVTNVDIFSHQVIAASYTPIDTTNPCSTGGQGTLYIFRVSCGEGYFGGTDADARRREMDAGMPTDPRVTVSPEGTRVIVTQQEGEIENHDGPPIDPDKISQLYWRRLFE